MKLATTTEDFKKYFPENDIERIKELAKAGFKHIDFSLFSCDIERYMQSDWKSKVSELKKVADDLGMDFVQMHSPATFEGGVKDGNYDLGIKGTIRSIEMCKELGIPMTVVHGADNPEVRTWEDKLELNRKFYKEFFSVMEETGVQVLTENSMAKSRESWFFPVFTGKQIYELCEYVNHPLFHACWDTGHANMQGHQYKDIVAIGKHLKAVHYNNNDGISDMHTAPFIQVMNDDEIMNALIKVGFAGPLTFECSNALTPKGKRVFEGENRLFVPPIEVARAYEKLLFESGKAILNAYNLFEE